MRQPGGLGSCGESSVASRRKRGPVALRHQLWLVLPLSTRDTDRLEKPVNSGMYGVGGNVRFGSAAVVQTVSSLMSGLGRLADADPRRMSALNDTGRSGFSISPIMNGSYRPGAEESNRQAYSSTSPNLCSQKTANPSSKPALMLGHSSR